MGLLLLQLLLLQPVPALAADPCLPSMAPIPGGTYRIGAAAQLPEEQPVLPGSHRGQQ